MKLSAVIRRPRRAYRRFRREQGNVIIITALLMTVFMGLLALTIDIGFLAGQRRFMQNGADAGALAAARMLAGAVSPRSNCNSNANICNFFSVNDADVRARATDIARQNQNAGLTGRTTAFSATLAYCVASGPTKYDYSVANNNCQAAGNSWVTSPTANGQVPDGAYKVRVTTNSTITTLFGRAAGWGTPGATTATSASAIAVVQGVCPPTVATGNIWPFTLWDQQDFGTDPNSLFMLWGSANPPAPTNTGSWKNVIDLTPPTKWCNGTAPDYTWAQGPTQKQLVPAPTTCTPNLTDPTKNFTGTDNSWNRTGYAQDPRGGCYTGNDDNPNDLAIWAAATYQGTLGVGMKMPLYTKGGDGGQNVAGGIYGPDVPCTNTYFFKNVTAIDPDHPTWGPYKDIVAFTYDIPNGTGPFYDSKALAWTDNANKGSLERVQLIRILTFRIYRDYSNVNSRVYGRVVSPVVPPTYVPPSCSLPNGGPNFSNNVVHMGQ
jgi:Flp pilus assembly protein TadG